MAAAGLLHGLPADQQLTRKLTAVTENVGLLLSPSLVESVERQQTASSCYCQGGSQNGEPLSPTQEGKARVEWLLSLPMPTPATQCMCVSLPLWWANTLMILPQVHLRKPCYDFYFL